MALVVVADDTDEIRALLVRVLRRGGHTVVDTSDGAAAPAAVHEHRPDAVVSDIDMPVMNGLDLCRAVRADPRTAGLPVVFVSGSMVPGDRRPADAEATAVLCKPFLAEELLACLDRAVHAGHRPGQPPTPCP